MGFDGIGREDMGLIQLAQDITQFRVFMYVMTKFRVSYELGNISTVLVIISLSGIHEVNLVIAAYNKNNKNQLSQSVQRWPMGWTVGVCFPTWERFSSSSYRPNHLWGPPGLPSNRYRRLFSGGKAAKA